MRQFEVKRYQYYAGFAYDGPAEGQWITSKYPDHRHPVQSPTAYYTALSSATSIITYIEYRWSDPLRAWVALNMR